MIETLEHRFRLLKESAEKAVKQSGGYRPGVVTVASAARRAAVAEKELLRRLSAGRLLAARPKDRRMIPRSELARLLPTTAKP